MKEAFRFKEGSMVYAHAYEEGGFNMAQTAKDGLDHFLPAMMLIISLWLIIVQVLGFPGFSMFINLRKFH